MEPKKKKIPGIYLIVIAAVCFLTFFFTSISTILSYYINSRTNNSNSENKIVGNLDNYITELDNQTLITNINKYDDKNNNYYLNVFNPIDKSFRQTQLSSYIETNNKPYIIGTYKNDIWIYNNGIFAYNLNTLRQDYSIWDIYKKWPFIEKVMAKTHTHYQLQNNKILINDNDTAFYSLDVEDLAIKIEENNFIFSPDKKALNEGKNFVPLRYTKNSLALIGDIDKRMYLKSGTNKNSEKVKTNLSFQNGKLLTDTTNNQLIELKDPHSIVIIHDDKMTNQGTHFTISSVSLKGVLQWIMFQSDIGLTPKEQNTKTIIDKVHLNSKEELIMMTKNPESAFAFDMKNGSILWKY